MDINDNQLHDFNDNQNLNQSSHKSNDEIALPDIELSEVQRRKESNLPLDAELGCELSNETDEFGQPFVRSSNGTAVFGNIAPESGLPALPIRLSFGENHKDDYGKNHGYGHLHIDAGHRDQILQNGFRSVEEFVEYVANNYTTIKLGNTVANHQTYLLEVPDEHNNTLIIQRSRDELYWTVNTAGVFSKKYSRKKQIVYTKPATKDDIDTDNSVSNSVQKDKGTESEINSSEPLDSTESTPDDR